MIKRRDALTAAGLGATALGGMLLSSASPSGAQTENTDSRTLKFWTSEVRKPYPETVQFGIARQFGGGDPQQASFFYWDEPSKTFRFGSAIGDEGLPDKGDINVILRVDRIRACKADQDRLRNYEGGSLRIDLQQTDKLPSLAERLAWTAIAGFLPEKKKLPELAQMNFNPGTAWGDLNTVPLPGGGGRWTWNFFLKRKKSRWMQVVDVIRRSKDLAIPIFGLGLPAIAVTALNTVDQIVGVLTAEDQTEWLFRSRDVYLYSTKSARDAFVGTKVRLKQGFYVVVPENAAGVFDFQAKNLELVDGLVVPKGTSPAQAADASKEVLEKVTYLTVGITAKAS